MPKTSSPQNKVNSTVVNHIKEGELLAGVIGCKRVCLVEGEYIVRLLRFVGGEPLTTRLTSHPEKCD